MSVLDWVWESRYSADSAWDARFVFVGDGEHNGNWTAVSGKLAFCLDTAGCVE